MVPEALVFFLDEGFGGVIFLFLEGSSSSLGGVTSPFLYSTSMPSSSSSLPPFVGEREAVFVDVLWISWTSTSFLVLRGHGVSDIASRLSTLDIFVGSIETRRSIDHSLVISSKSYSVSL
jgi:hypothetical protein